MKHIKRLFVLTIFIITLMIGSVAIKGYVNYNYILDEIGLENTIDTIVMDENFVSIENVSDTLIDAVVSTEDKRFYQHNGVDLLSIGRAIIIDIRYMEYKTGGSTITQQLAKNLFLSFDKTLERKATEYFLAKKN